MIRIVKFKILKDGGVSIKWERPNGSSMDEYQIRCWDEPDVGLVKAMAVLREDVIEMCELKDDPDLVFVKGVSFSYGGDNDTMGAVITAQKKLIKSNAPLMINTPHKSEEPYAEGAGGDLLSPECVQRLYDLQGVVGKYIDGERAQQTMFKDGLKESKEELAVVQ